MRKDTKKRKMDQQHWLHAMTHSLWGLSIGNHKIMIFLTYHKIHSLDAWKLNPKNGEIDGSQPMLISIQIDGKSSKHCMANRTAIGSERNRLDYNFMVNFMVNGDCQQTKKCASNDQVAHQGEPSDQLRIHFGRTFGSAFRHSNIQPFELLDYETSSKNGHSNVRRETLFEESESWQFFAWFSLNFRLIFA